MRHLRCLDASNEHHLTALHYVYQPRINRSLADFKSGHNNGPISSEGNQSPEQLWINGMIRNRGPHGTVAREFAEQVNVVNTTIIYYSVDID
jgi:hypothetical protein